MNNTSRYINEDTSTPSDPDIAIVVVTPEDFASLVAFSNEHSPSTDSLIATNTELADPHHGIKLRNTRPPRILPMVRGLFAAVVSGISNQAVTKSSGEPRQVIRQPRRVRVREKQVHHPPKYDWDKDTAATVKAIDEFTKRTNADY